MEAKQKLQQIHCFGYFIRFLYTYYACLDFYSSKKIAYRNGMQSELTSITNNVRLKAVIKRFNATWVTKVLLGPFFLRVNTTAPTQAEWFV